MQPCRLRMCPQTAQEGGRRRQAGRQGRVGVSPRRVGQAPDQHFLGPVTVPECSRRVYSMQAQMADRFRGLLCFLSFSFSSAIRAARLHVVTPPVSTHVRTHARKLASSEENGGVPSVPSPSSSLSVLGSNMKPEYN